MKQRIRFLITAGPTHEHLDPVRYLANASTGKMGYALAEEARKKDHDVTLITGPTDLGTPEGITTHRVTSAEEMHRAVLRALPGADCLIMAAAVSDYRPAERSREKIPRKADTWSLPLVKNPDIVADARRREPGKVIVAFSLETDPGEERARRKMEEKGVDFVVQNAPETIGSDTITCRILHPDGGRDVLSSLAKSAAARRILRAAEKLVLKSRERR